MPFKCLLRADGVSDAVVAALKRAGCRTAWIGAESGSQRILDAMEKGTRVEQIAAAARRLHGATIGVGFSCSSAIPGETLEDIELTLRMVRDCRPDDIGVSVSYLLPGTPFYDRVKAQLGEKQNWVDSNDLAMMYRATYARSSTGRCTPSSTRSSGRENSARRTRCARRRPPSTTAFARRGCR